MRTINVRFLLLLLVSLFLFASTVYGLHSYQSGRLGAAFLKLAQDAEEKDEYSEAISYYKKYLMLVPDDANALAEYGLLLSEHGNASPAFFTLERALRIEPDRDDLRRALVKVALKIGRFSDAQTHLQEHLIPQSPDDGELLTMLGACQYSAGEYKSAADSFQLAIENAPEKLDAYQGLVDLYRGPLKRPGEALMVLKRLVDNNPDLSDAYLVRGTYMFEKRAEKEVQAAVSGQTSPQEISQESIKSVVQFAAADGHKALELDPENVQALLLLARCVQESDQFDEARKYLDQAVQLSPKHPMIYNLRADVSIREGQPQEAVSWLEKGLEVIPNQGDLLWNLANLLVDQQQLERAKEAATRLRAIDYPKETVAFLEARILVAEQQWLAAAKQIESLRPALTQWPDLAKQAEYHLGTCYQQLGKVDLQLTAFRRAVTVDPFWLPARLGTAQALLSLGRVDEAFEEFQHAAHLPGVTTGVLLDLARLDILRNLRRNPSQRDWQDAEKILAQIEKQSPDTFAVPILRAEINVARGDDAAAETVLLKARDANPKQVELWSTLIALAQRQNDTEKARKYLAAADQEIGDNVTLRLSEARLIVVSNSDAKKEELISLGQGAEGFSIEERLRLKRGLASLAIAVGDHEHAEKLCLELAQLDPNNLSIHLLLFDLALMGDRTSVLESALDNIHRIEGDGPLWHYGEAIKTMIQGKQGDPKGFVTAEKHLAEARVARPAWSRIPLLMAEIDDVQEDSESAIRHYLEAIELGERNPRAISRVVRLLYEQKRYVEADQVIRRLQEQRSPFSGEMVRMAADISLRLDEFDRAIELAEEAAENSNNYRDHLWLAQVLGVLGRQEEADAKFRQSLELSSDAPEVWVAYVGFLARSGQSEKAQQIIAEAKQTLPADKAPLALASCYETLKQLGLAEEKYQEAVTSSPDDVKVLRRIATFYLAQGKVNDALPYLEKLVKGDGEIDPADLMWGRRNLAMVVGSRGDQQGYERAMTLLDQNLAKDAKSLDDRRVKAIVLAQRGQSDQRGEAIQLLEDVVKRQAEPRADDVYLLSRLRIAEADYLLKTQNRPSDASLEWSKARRLMRGLLAENPDDPRYVQTYVDALLRRGENQEAELWLKQLSSIDSEGLGFLSLQVQVFLANNQHEEALRVLRERNEELSADTSQDLRETLVLARLLEASGLRLEETGKGEEAAEFFTEAEKLYKIASQGDDGDKLLLAGFYARRQKFDEALEMATSAIERSSPEQIANFATNITRQAKSTSLDSLERYLSASLKSHADAAPILLVLADVYAWQQRGEEAESVYRRVLEQSPNNVAVLNNLAFLLALREHNLEESKQLIGRAIDIAGPRSALLDSRGVIYAMSGDYVRALQDLQMAIAESPSANRLFHLALALERAGDKAAARDAMSKAKERGANTDEFYPWEKDLYLRLEASLQRGLLYWIICSDAEDGK